MTALAEIDWAAFHAERQTGIGGSDAAGCVGLSRHSSPWSIWARLAGLTEPEPDTMRQHIGREMEPVIASLFRRETGLMIGGEQTSVRHRRAGWARGYIDGLVFEGNAESVDDAIGGFEAKTDGRFGWPDGVPVDYQAQAQWYMLITGLPMWWIGVMFANFRFEVFELAANKADQGLLARRAGYLWHRHVLTGIPPAVDDSDATTDALRAVYPEHVEGETASLDGLADLIVERAELKDREKATKARLTLIDNTLKAAIGDAEIGVLHGLPAFTYRTSEVAGYVVEPRTQRTLRPVKAKTPKGGAE